MCLINNVSKLNIAEKVEVSDTTMLSKVSTAGHKIFILIICILLSNTQASAQTKHNFSLSKNDFLLDGKPFQVISGEMHPARIPMEYWRQRIQMAKAMGCNTIAAYIFWNYHEQKENVPMRWWEIKVKVQGTGRAKHQSKFKMRCFCSSKKISIMEANQS